MSRQPFRLITNVQVPHELMTQGGEGLQLLKRLEQLCAEDNESLGSDARCDFRCESVSEGQRYLVRVHMDSEARPEPVTDAAQRLIDFFCRVAVDAFAVKTSDSHGHPIEFVRGPVEGRNEAIAHLARSYAQSLAMGSDLASEQQDALLDAVFDGMAVCVSPVAEALADLVSHMRSIKHELDDGTVKKLDAAMVLVTAHHDRMSGHEYQGGTVKAAGERQSFLGYSEMKQAVHEGAELSAEEPAGESLSTIEMADSDEDPKGVYISGSRFDADYIAWMVATNIYDFYERSGEVADEINASSGDGTIINIRPLDLIMVIAPVLDLDSEDPFEGEDGDPQHPMQLREMLRLFLYLYRMKGEISLEPDAFLSRVGGHDFPGESESKATVTPISAHPKSNKVH